MIDQSSCRTVETWNHDTAQWVPCTRLQDLRKGQVFRMFEPEGRRVQDEEGDVWLCLEDGAKAVVSARQDGINDPGIESIPHRGIPWDDHGDKPWGESVESDTVYLLEMRSFNKGKWSAWGLHHRGALYGHDCLSDADLYLTEISARDSADYELKNYGQPGTSDFRILQYRLVRTIQIPAVKPEVEESEDR